MSDPQSTPPDSTEDAGPGGTPDTDDVGISDDQLPEDLRPTDDNPLAQPSSEDQDEEGGISLGPDGPQ